MTGTLAGPDIKWVSKPLVGNSQGRRRGLCLAGRGQGRTPIRWSRCPNSKARWSPWIRAPAACWRWSAASPSPRCEFNRATQALRQPGSSFKPIVYAAALDNGYTPASVVLDAPVEIRNADGSIWRPENYAQQFYGPQTLRRGIEQSRNVMTVRLAKDIGMPLVAEYAKLFGVYDSMQPVLAMALGAGETTDMRMTAAYATIANGGRKIVPTLIDRIQDRYGDTVYKHDSRLCEGCTATSWEGQGEPLIIDNREQVLDPMTAYQITSMMEGVVQRGTGTAAKSLNRPVAGKTGTTNDYKDAWFVGFTPELAVGVYVGFDQPRKMGNAGDRRRIRRADLHRVHGQGAGGQARDASSTCRPNMTEVWINPKSGVKAVTGDAAVLEAFKPGTGPNLVTSVIGVDSNSFVNVEQQQQCSSNNSRATGSIWTRTWARGGLF